MSSIVLHHWDYLCDCLCVLAMANEPFKGKGKMKAGELNEAWRLDIERQHQEALQQEMTKGKGKGKLLFVDSNRDSDVSTDSDSRSETVPRGPSNSRRVTDKELDRNVKRKLFKD